MNDVLKRIVARTPAPTARSRTRTLWQDPGTWIALGVSALFVVAGFVMHRVFVRVLKTPEPPAVDADQPVPPKDES